MNLFYYCTGAYLAGVPTAWAFGKYLMAVEKRKPMSAAVCNIMVLSLSTLVTLSLWSSSGDSPAVFLGWILGNSTGTYLVVKQAKEHENV